MKFSMNRILSRTKLIKDHVFVQLTAIATSTAGEVIPEISNWDTSQTGHDPFGQLFDLDMMRQFNQDLGDIAAEFDPSGLQYLQCPPWWLGFDSSALGN